MTGELKEIMDTQHLTLTMHSTDGLGLQLAFNSEQNPGQLLEELEIHPVRVEPRGSCAGRAPWPTQGKPQVSAHRGAGARAEYLGGCHGASRTTRPYPSRPRPEVPHPRLPDAGRLWGVSATPRGCPDPRLASA